MEKGDKIAVEWGGSEYPAKVLKVENDQVLVHYIRYNGRFDEWLDVSDNRLLWPKVDENLNKAEEQGTDKEMSDDSLKSSSSESSDDSNVDDTGMTTGRIDTGTVPSPSAHVSERNISTQRSSTPRRDAPSDGEGNANRRAVLRDENAECGFCRLRVEDRKVKCSGCSSFFHGDPLCLGVSANAVNVLVTETSGGVLYRCCNCRFREAPAGEGLAQLSRIVGELVREVRSAGTREQPQIIPRSSAPRSHGPSGRTDMDRDEILSQIRELREREKRRNAIILRGLGDVSVAVMTSKFARICEYLGVGQITLGSIKKVGSGMIYRTVIEDDEKRRELLSKCHRLRSSSEFSRIYLNRDLTHQQRRDLQEKRQQTRRGAQRNDQALPEANTGELLNRNRTPRRDDQLSGANAVIPNSRALSDMPSRLTTMAAPRGRGRGRPSGGGRGGGSGRGRNEASPSYGASVRDQVFTNSWESRGRNGGQARRNDAARGERNSRRPERSASQSRRPNHSRVSIGGIPHNRRNLNF